MVIGAAEKRYAVLFFSPYHPLSLIFKCSKISDVLKLSYWFTFMSLFLYFMLRPLSILLIKPKFSGFAKCKCALVGGDCL